MRLRSQSTTPSENTRSRASVGGKPISARSAIRTPRRARFMRDRPPCSSAAKGTDISNQSVLDMRAAESCVDQAHITTHPGWRVMDLSENQCERDDDILDLEDEELLEVQYAEEFAVTLYQLSADRKWIDLGPGQLILEACIYSSRAVVRMAKTHRILANWNIFGGMKVARFLTTVIAVGIVTDDDGSQRVVSYGLRVETLERAKDLAILLSSNTRGMQMNLDRLVPKVPAEQRAKILDNMTDRLIVLQRRLGVLNNNSKLSALVESELSSMLEMGAELKY
ncbi:hypothetical protein BDV93DRAFT_24666 [Ceratobasidium sp. AG-I]|nr:hypothetical protein BDV93DRAFT_24666 [Ceratobasidium sp. AG-I]